MTSKECGKQLMQSIKKDQTMKEKKLSHLMVALCLTCLVVLVVCFSIILICFSLSNIRKDENNYTLVLKTIEQGIDSSIENTIQQFVSIGYSDNMLAFLEGDTAQTLKSQPFIRTNFESLRLLNPLVLDVYVEFDNGHLLYTSVLDNGGFSHYSNYLKAKNFFQTQQSNKISLSPCYSVGTKQQYMFALYVPVFNYSVKRSQDYKVGSITGLCDVAALFEKNDNILITIVDSQQQIIYQSSPEMMSQNHEDEVRHHYRFLSSNQNRMGWNVTVYYPFQLISSETKTAIRWITVCLIMAMLVFVFLCFLFYKMILEPIGVIVKQMEAIESGNERICNSRGSSNELITLTNGINHMLENISGLNEKIVLNERIINEIDKKKLSEKILFLQSQMNPHFLFNNLECIRGMVFMEEYDGILEMTSCMASIYRYCVNDWSIVPLENELLIFQDYIKIISLRYFDAFEFFIDVGDELKREMIPRMILQPIAENSIIHGFKEAGIKFGKIRISATKESHRLLILVDDDGIGIAPEKIDELNHDFMTNLESEMGKVKIGLHNINNRVRLLFGNDSYIKISNRNPGGTRVEIVIANTGTCDAIRAVQRPGLRS